MQGPTHLLISWYAAEAVGLDSPRNRRIVALSGLAPDLDVLAYVAGIGYYDFDRDLAFEHVWSVVHHRYTHGLGFILLTGIVAWLLVRNREPDQSLRVAALAMAACAIHVFCDLVGGGPTWPVYPAWPISDFAWSAPWSWTLAQWPNTVILFSLLAGMFLYARLAARSPLESINYRLDHWFVTIVRQGAYPEAAGQRISSGGNRSLRIWIYLFLALLVLAVLAPLDFDASQFNWF